MGYKCFHFLFYTFPNCPKFYTNHVLSFSSDETKFLFLKTPTYFEMSNVLHLDCLLLLIRSTGAHSSFVSWGSVTSFMGYYKILLASPSPVQLCSSLHSAARVILHSTTLITRPCLKAVNLSPSFTH